MNTTFLKIILLAAVSDGQIQPEEIKMLTQFKNAHPQFKTIPDQTAQEALADIYNKFSAGMETKQILEQLAEHLTMSNKETAYALAKEVCASDFNLSEPENEFLKMIENQWGISQVTIAAVEKSIKLRYFS